MFKASKRNIILIVSGFLFIAGLFSGCWAVNKNIDTDNTEADLRISIDAKKKDQEASFDNMWKILSQKAQVADQYKKAFKEIYPELIDGRYSQGDGTFMKWIQESNPTFDVSLYKDVMNSITAERNSFLTVQRQLIDLKREHDKLFVTWPSKWFVNNGLQPIEITIVSSSHAKDVIKTGVDDDVDLFKSDTE